MAKHVPIPTARRARSLAALAILALGAGLAVPGAARAQDADAMRAAVEKQVAKMAQLQTAGDGTGVGLLYARDAVVMPPNSEPVVGREAIQALWTEMVAAGNPVSLTTKDIIVAGEYAIETGVYGVNTPDGTHLDHGSYVAVWMKTAEGMQMIRDIWNTNMAPAN